MSDDAAKKLTEGIRALYLEIDPTIVADIKKLADSALTEARQQGMRDAAEIARGFQVRFSDDASKGQLVDYAVNTVAEIIMERAAKIDKPPNRA